MRWLRKSSEPIEKHPSGAEARTFFAALSARLKSCPDTRRETRTARDRPWQAGFLFLAVAIKFAAVNAFLHAKHA
jgi:hypothetical protein